VRPVLYIPLLTLLLAALCQPAAAQELGVYNSIKGIGAQYRSGEKAGVFHSATAFVDIYGVPTSRCRYPGYRFNVTRQYMLRSIEGDKCVFSFYAGPGISFGLVRDHDKGRGFDLTSLIADNPGVMLALSGGAGCRFDFGRRVALDLSFTAEAGVHMRENEDEKSYSATSLSIYNNGLLQAIYPQLTILFKL